jgi:hypothetical protein
MFANQLSISLQLKKFISEIFHILYIPITWRRWHPRNSAIADNSTVALPSNGKRFKAKNAAKADC